MENIDDNNNTPAIMSNAVVSWQATPRLRLHSHVLFEGKQTTYNLDVVEVINSTLYMGVIEEAIKNKDYAKVAEYQAILSETANKLVMHKEMPARFIFNIGADYKWNKFTFGLNIRNLFNHQYFRSGMNTNVVFQKGRWYMFDVAYKF